MQTPQKINPHRIKAILADQDFVAFVDMARATLTEKVMHHATGEDSRTAYLAEFHGLNRFIASMQATAQEAEDQST